MAVLPIHSDHTGGDRRKNEDALQPFAKDENANVHERDSRTGRGKCRIGRPVRSDSLPDKNGNYAQCRKEQSDTEGKAAEQ